MHQSILVLLKIKHITGLPFELSNSFNYICSESNGEATALNLQLRQPLLLIFCFRLQVAQIILKEISDAILSAMHQIPSDLSTHNHESTSQGSQSLQVPYHRQLYSELHALI